MYVFHMREWCLYHIIIIFLRDAASPAGDLAFLASKLKTKDSYSFGEKAERFFRLILDSLIFMLWLYEKKNVTLLMILHHGTISKRPVEAYFPNKSTVFENDRECLIQHCERSELRLLFEWTNAMVHFGEILKTWSLRSNSVTRQVSFNWNKISWKCQNCKIQIRHFGWFLNNVNRRTLHIINAHLFRMQNVRK